MTAWLLFLAFVLGIVVGALVERAEWKAGNWRADGSSPSREEREADERRR